MPTTNLQLPHLVSFCQEFELRTSPHCRAVSTEGKKWALASSFLDENERRSIPGLQLGLLASLCYPTCDMTQLSTIVQLMVVFVHWINTLPACSCDGAETAFRQLWTRLRRTSSPDWQARFQRHLRAFRIARATAARDNEQGAVPDLESYVALRRDSSGIKMLLDLIEYAEGLLVSDEEHAAPLLHHLRRDACDVIAWSCDIAAYAKKHASRDRHNIVSVLMVERRLPMQGAMHAAGALVKDTVDNFIANERMLERSADVDADVRRFVRGLRDCMVGVTHWLYETDRFFGEIGDEVRELGWVFLYPN